MFLDGFGFSVEVPGIQMISNVMCGFLLSAFGASLTFVACALGLQGLLGMPYGHVWFPYVFPLPEALPRSFRDLLGENYVL